MTNKVIEEAMADMTSGQIQRTLQMARKMAVKQARMALKRAKRETAEGVSPRFPTLDKAGRPIEDPPDVLLAKAAETLIAVEDGIARVRERYAKTDGAALALMHAMHGRGESHSVKIELVECGEETESAPEPAADAGEEGTQEG